MNFRWMSRKAGRRTQASYLVGDKFHKKLLIRYWMSRGLWSYELLNLALVTMKTAYPAAVAHFKIIKVSKGNSSLRAWNQ